MSYWATGAAAAVSIGSSYLGGKSEQKSLKDARKAFEKGRDVYGMQAAGMADPFMQHRPWAADRLQGILSGEQDFRTDPGYEFVRSEAMRGVSRQGHASGYGHSGNLYAGLQNRAAGLASTEYGNIIDRLTTLAGATPSNAQAAGSIYGQTNIASMQGIGESYGLSGASKKDMTGNIGGQLSGLIGGFGGGGGGGLGGQIKDIFDSGLF